MAAVACALTLAGLSPLGAAGPLALADGSLLSVWEVCAATPGTAAGRGAGGALAWSIQDDSGSRGGIIAPTGDAAPDTDVRLFLDPATGTPVLLWSRAESGTFKIHHARWDGVNWSDVHALTFGPGNDRHPRVGFDVTGATLFFMADGGRYFYAPFDAVHGRLFAVPRMVARLDGRAAAGPPIRSGGGLMVNGGTDAPVPPAKTCPSDCTSTGSSWSGTTAGTGTHGGQDVPVPPAKSGSKSDSASGWGVAGDVACISQVLVVPARVPGTALVVRFRRGDARVVDRIAVPSPVPDAFGDLTARTYLPVFCND
jgi:hypothetical protein